MTYLPAAERYDGMRYNRVGRSGLKLPALSLGLWHNFGRDRPFETQRAIVRRAFDLGITHFDLADNYGPPPGGAEENFGRLLATDLAPYRDELVISSKAGFPMWPGPYGDLGSRKHLLASLDQSLGRLGLDYVDIVFCHRPDPDTPIDETVRAMHDVIAAGKAIYWGTSEWNAGEIAAAHAIAERHHLHAPVTEQPQYNLFHRQRVETEYARLYEDLGLGTTTWSPLASGLLSGKYNAGVPADSRASIKGFEWLAERILEPTRLAKVQSLVPIAQELGCTLAQMSIAWCLMNPHVSTVITGASRPAQVTENMKAQEVVAKLTPDVMARIDAVTAN
jgi:L-glyceraldehyde 3-phosphate reductase